MKKYETAARTVGKLNTNHTEHDPHWGGSEGAMLAVDMIVAVENNHGLSAQNLMKTEGAVFRTNAQ